MTNDEIRVAVATELGWEGIRMSGPWECSDPGEECEDLCGYIRGSVHRSLLPHFEESIDACAQFEATLTDVTWGAYARAILRITEKAFPYRSTCRLLRATALHRCEAFLRVKGKWGES